MDTYETLKVKLAVRRVFFVASHLKYVLYSSPKTKRTLLMYSHILVYQVQRALATGVMRRVQRTVLRALRATLTLLAQPMKSA